MAIKIIISDDHQLFRDGIANLLASSPEIEIVAQAENGHEVIEKTLLFKPDIVIMDISLPNINGVDATRILHKEVPNTKILVLTMHAEKNYIKEALEAGAYGYLFKDCTYDQLIEAIYTVYQGKKYLSNKITEILIHDYLSKDEDLNVKDQVLSERESEILKLLAEGKTTREISNTLFISVKTVGTHKQHILEKLKLKSNSDLIRYAIKKGIIGLG
ncbi:MAG TPA: response regulator transcription factor [Prolixibacteraceae bacterium]|nr:response regulator transcription factor [Prolixibacteraceae bacterium]